MGLLWDYIPTPYFLKFQGGTPKHFLNYFSSNRPLSVLEGFQSQLLFNFFGHNGVRSSMHAYIHTSIHACMRTYIHACMHAYIHT